MFVYKTNNLYRFLNIFMISLSSRIKSIRNHVKLSQEKFAEKIGVSRSTLALIETDKSMPGYDTLKKVCDTFSIKPAFFFDDAEPSIENYSEEPHVTFKEKPVQLRRPLTPAQENEIDERSKTIKGLERDANLLKSRLQYELEKDDSNHIKLFQSVKKFAEMVELLELATSEYLNFYDPTQQSFFPNFLDPNPSLPTYNQYKKHTLNKIEELKPYQGRIDKLHTAISNFLKDIKPLDKEDIIYLSE
ncbi:hypothetical protein CJD36_008185 [Flavipsychrobacter stenotrophus]|uniref:HTH cro/C1-type domain-containing protein n=1 Tax=Flavipsychrobacter stenotrophus TaxID=2077091 RepID=A0A2S7SXV5_9BACT|nr:helix-turn-helix transcriptional regulator [Flavipsychrobacter stenotrophus]PQJ11763.1 hypothetical protein CJD36_008185 [Flavipsychrobacter stenotrophus]